MGIFYREKVFHAGKKIRKNEIAPPPPKNMTVTPLGDGKIFLEYPNETTIQTTQRKERLPKIVNGLAGAVFTWRFKVGHSVLHLVEFKLCYFKNHTLK